MIANRHEYSFEYRIMTMNYNSPTSCSSILPYGNSSVVALLIDELYITIVNVRSFLDF